ncbi:MAG: hypothetical protein WBB28_23590 [Crinalium sp.]
MSRNRRGVVEDSSLTKDYNFSFTPIHPHTITEYRYGVGMDRRGNVGTELPNKLIG